MLRSGEAVRKAEIESAIADAVKASEKPAEANIKMNGWS
jgi:hypothetical protein